MYNGILIVDKPQDFTSHDVVAKLRGILRQRKIGHAGTLDPMATGVLVVLLGQATRASDDAAASQKEYAAALRLGLVTDTQDIWGRVTEQHKVPSVIDWDILLPRFRGEILQQPPMYSAVQIDGQRLYKLARKGIEVERPPRPVTIHRLEWAMGEGGDWRLEVCCSKGTYIRTLCHDIGQAIGCGGVMTALRRTRAGAFLADHALCLADVERLHREGRLTEHLHPAESVYTHLPAVTLTEEGCRLARNGVAIGQRLVARGEVPPSGNICRVYSEEHGFLMTGRVEEAGEIKADKTFFPIL